MSMKRSVLHCMFHFYKLKALILNSANLCLQKNPFFTANNYEDWSEIVQCGLFKLMRNTADGASIVNEKHLTTNLKRWWWTKIGLFPARDLSPLGIWSLTDTGQAEIDVHDK